MRLDVHAHYVSHEYLDVLDRLGGIEPGTEIGRQVAWRSLEEDLEERFRVMEQAQVARQFLSISGLMPYFADAAKATEAARGVNDTYADLVRRYPDRFAAFGCLPLPDIDAALAETERVLDQLGMLGVTLATSVLGRDLGDAHFDPLYAELDRRGSVLFIHPAGLACGSPDIRKSGLLWPLGGTAEDTLCVVSMLRAGFTQRFPNVRVIVPHLGGTLPFLLHRLDRPLRRFMPDQAPLGDVAKRFWYDTVNGHAPALRCACETLGADRLVFGTDYPFFKEGAYKGAADAVLGAGLGDEVTQQIFSGNAERLFGTAVRATP